MMTLRSCWTLNDFCTKKKNFFLLVIVYDKVGDGYKFLYHNYDLAKSLFHATSKLKVNANNFFS